MDSGITSTRTAQGERDAVLDGIRCMSNYLIVLLHAWGASCQYCDPSTFEASFWTFLGTNGSVGLDILFLISGYLLFRNYSLAEWPRKMRNRVKRLMAPYLSWNIVFVAFYLALYRIFPRLRARVESFNLTSFEGIVSKIIHPIVLPIDVPLWFMRTVFVFAAVSPIAWAMLCNRVARWLGLSIVVSYWLAAAVFGIVPDWQACSSSTLLMLYCGGALSASGRPLAVFFAPRWWIVPGACALILDSLATYWGIAPLGNDVLFVMKAPTMIHILGRIRVFRPTKWFRSFTFFVYCGHFLFCSLWVHTFGPMLSHMASGKYTLLMFVFLVPGLATTWMCYCILKRFSPRLAKFFDGTWQ